MELLPGQRCLLIGANGAGKSTLLRVLAGKHMVPAGSVRVLGQSPFHDTQLSGTGELSYIGGSWDRDIAFAGYSIPLQVCLLGLPRDAQSLWHAWLLKTPGGSCASKAKLPSDLPQVSTSRSQADASASAEQGGGEVSWRCSALCNGEHDYQSSDGCMAGVSFEVQSKSAAWHVYFEDVLAHVTGPSSNL